VAGVVPSVGNTSTFVSHCGRSGKDRTLVRCGSLSVQYSVRAVEVCNGAVMADCCWQHAVC
jgi:hypothetical protein